MKKMTKYMKIGITLIVISVASIATATVVINNKVLKPLSVINTDSIFDGIIIEVDTDKDVYKSGEEIAISVSLSNTDMEDYTLFCQGLRDTITNEIYADFHVTIYDTNYNKIWYHTTPDKDEICKYSPYSDAEDNPSINVTLTDGNMTMRGEIVPVPNGMFPKYETYSFTIDINASATRIFDNILSWNQTAKNNFAVVDDHNKQVPPGEYIISVTVPLSMEHYYGSSYKMFYFGSSKTITII